MQIGYKRDTAFRNRCSSLTSPRVRIACAQGLIDPRILPNLVVFSSTIMVRVYESATAAVVLCVVCLGCALSFVRVRYICVDDDRKHQAWCSFVDTFRPIIMCVLLLYACRTSLLVAGDVTSFTIRHLLSRTGVTGNRRPLWLQTDVVGVRERKLKPRINCPNRETKTDVSL